MKKAVLRYGFLLLSVGIAVMIFLFSAQSGEISGETSGDLSEKFLRFFFPLLDLSNPKDEALLLTFGGVVRKVAHFAEYFLLGGSLLGFFATFSLEGIRLILPPFLTGALYAVSDEVHQIFIPQRGPSGWDVLLDSFGVICGVLVGYCIFHWILNKKKRRQP